MPEYCSNCFIEAIKAKLKDYKNIKIIYVKPHHFMWHNLKSDKVYDFAQSKMARHWIELLWYKGFIRDRSYKVYERWLGDGKRRSVKTMRQFIETMIARLEERKKEVLPREKYLFGGIGVANAEGFNSGIEASKEIANQLAEEYGECDLCYLGGPCEYQKEGLRVDDNDGWIHANSERLPEDDDIYEVTAQFKNGVLYTEFAYYDHDREEWWKHDEDGLVNVIAWKEHTPRFQKGEKR